MADIQTSNSSGGKKRARKHSVRVDMTPMVDLAFLLLTFFILTTSMKKATSMQMTFPLSKGPSQPTSNALTLILTENNRILYYVGELTPETKFQETAYNKVGKLIRGLNQTAFNQIKEVRKKYAHLPATSQLQKQMKKSIDSIQSCKTTLFCIIKPDEFATYGNMVDVVDEMDINGVNKYAVTDKFQLRELELIKQIQRP